MATSPPLVRVRPETVHPPLWARLTWALVKMLSRACWRCARHPALTVLFAAIVTAVIWSRTVSPYGPAYVAAVVLVLLVVWRLAHAGSFRLVVGFPFRSTWRRLFVYRIGWQPAMVACRLTKTLAGQERVPRILSVRSTGSVDRVRVRLLPGQVLDDYASVCDRLAASFEAVDCRVRTIPRTKIEGLRARRSGRVAVRSTKRLELWFLVTDPLTAPVEPFDVQDAPDLTSLPVARCEDGSTWHARLLGTHTLVVGVTGAGKGSVIWSIIRAIGPLVASRTVELWVIDPKGGMELAAGRRLFTRFCYGRPDPSTTTDQAEAVDTSGELTYAGFLEDAVAVMRARQDRLMGICRQHIPAPDDPLILIVIDELASLTSYVVDRDAKKRIAAALALLQSQGRAGGVNLLAAVQDPRKETIPDRGLFPTRLALRLAEPQEVDQVAGAGARAKGARADQIPESLPGVGYACVEGIAEPLRIRFAYISDDEINTMCGLFDPARQTTSTTAQTTSGTEATR